MIFNFLRKYLRDEEYEQTKVELAETRAVLSEYKSFLEEQRAAQDQARETVDPDFLVLVWASIGFAFVIFSEAGREAIKLKGAWNNPVFYVWLVIAFFSFWFIVSNSLFALDLTHVYAKVKSNRAYIGYARFVIAGAILLTIGVFVLAFFK